MQKKLIALAVAGLVSAPAFAQSNVTIYGLVDMGVSYRSDNADSTVGSRTSIDSGVQSGSRIGFRGVEDLGNGLKAGFVLEQGLFVDNGQSRTDGTFSRQSYVYLGGGFGTVALGRQYSPQFNILTNLDPFGTGTVGQVNNLYEIDTRLDNTVAYVSPSFSGLTVTAAYSTDAAATIEAKDGWNQEGKGNVGDVRVWAISPVYNNGPLMVGLNYHQLKEAKTPGADKEKVWDLGGSYDFGMVKLAGVYGNRKVSGAFDQDSWMVGVTVPVGAAGKVLASYVRTETDITGVAAEEKGRQWALGYTHDLSKRTNLYAAYADISNKNGSEFSVGDSSNGGLGYQEGLNVGVRHRF